MKNWIKKLILVILLLFIPSLCACASSKETAAKERRNLMLVNPLEMPHNYKLVDKKKEIRKGKHLYHKQNKRQNHR